MHQYSFCYIDTLTAEDYEEENGNKKKKKEEKKKEAEDKNRLRNDGDG